jgi:hypothetical protein
MNNEEIIEYNKRCALFLGDEGMQKICEDNAYHYPSLEEMKFHSDWNWIMELCRKLDTLSEDDIVEWTDDYVVLSEELDNSVTRNYDINDVVKAVNKFLIWYEQNK